jgi:N4-gp56 family major capsid protein
MAGEIVSTTTTLNDLLPSIVAEAMFQAQEQSILRGLVKNYTLPFGSGKTITVPKYAAVTAVPLTEADDMTASAVSTDSAVLTVSEVGVMTNVSDLSIRTSASNVIADVGRLFGNAIAKKMDQDLVALFASFSVGLGDGTTAITAAKIFEAVAKLRAQGLSTDGIACVLHPEVAYDLKSSITSTFAAPASEMGNTAMRTGLVGMMAGVPVYESANITSTAGDSVGAIFHRDALGLAVLNDMSIESERNASARATELVATATYGVGELYDAYGIKMNFDSSIVDA